MSSISKVIKIVQDAGFHLESNGEGLWRVDGSEWFEPAKLEQMARDLKALASMRPIGQRHPSG